ncbi:head decoration protein [Chenggangzhangella methanolivorans]|uniref:Head decoration protein n=1 Tax=Chenggangzhangella methanolivorans TaxID=1437009 RepID=A0A9E6R9I0_9HYPH|nr:head decoration protein [Chenggangzhangella methanolivorans]QZN99789.1 head decoration protein [Chenggangzhangella methanolivorans]
MTAYFGNDGSVSADDGLVCGEVDSARITLASGQNLQRGALLGKITASGKYILSLSAANDGSQTPAVVLAEDCDASAADKVTVAYFRGRFDAGAMTFGTGQTVANTREALRDVGVFIHDSIR